MKKPRRNHSAAFKARVALEAIRGEKTLTEIAARHALERSQVAKWKTYLVDNAAAIFSVAAIAADGNERIPGSVGKVGKRPVERDSLDGVLGKFSTLRHKR